jgi:hypothetical protein
MEQKHSGLGIASFIISIPVGILIFLTITIAGVMEVSTPGGLNEESPKAVLLGMLLLGCFFLELSAIGLGIGGLLQKDRKKVFSILGLSFSGGTILFTGFLILLGSVA